MNTVTFLKIIFVFLTVFFTLVNVGKVIVKEEVPFLNFLLQTIGIVGLITIFFFI